MDLVSSTKKLIAKMREIGWEDLLKKVKLFCEEHKIDIPDLNARYVGRRGQSRRQQDDTGVEHYYRVDVFIATIYFVLQELNNRFNKGAVELLTLSSALNPINGYKMFDINDICKLANTFYLEDFTEQEKGNLKTQLQLFELDVPRHPDLKNLLTLSELCQGLVRVGK